MTAQEFKDWFAEVFDDLEKAVVRATGATLDEVQDAVLDVLVDMIRSWDRFADRVEGLSETTKVTIRRPDGQPGDTLFVYLRRAIIRRVFRNRGQHDPLDPGGMTESDPDDPVDPDRDERGHQAGRRLAIPGGLNPIAPVDVLGDVARRELNDRYRTCVKSLSDPHRSYLITRFCAGEFRLTTRGRRIPPALDTLRRCLMKTQLAFEELAELGAEWLEILCGEFHRGDRDVTPVGGI